MSRDTPTKVVNGENLLIAHPRSGTSVRDELGVQR